MRKKIQLTRREMEKFEAYLRHDEREPATIDAYLRSLRKFAEWADSRAITKELAAARKAELVEAAPTASAATCKNMPDNKKSPRVRSSSPKAVWEWTGNRSGPK